MVHRPSLLMHPGHVQIGVSISGYLHSPGILVCLVSYLLWVPLHATHLSYGVGVRGGSGCSVTSVGVWSCGSCLLGLLPFPLPFVGDVVVGVVLGSDWLGSAVGVLLCKSAVSVEITGYVRMWSNSSKANIFPKIEGRNFTIRKNNFCFLVINQPFKQERLGTRLVDSFLLLSVLYSQVLIASLDFFDFRPDMLGDPLDSSVVRRKLLREQRSKFDPSHFWTIVCKMSRTCQESPPNALMRRLPQQVRKRQKNVKARLRKSNTKNTPMI